MLSKEGQMIIALAFPLMFSRNSYEKLTGISRLDDIFHRRIRRDNGVSKKFEEATERLLQFAPPTEKQRMTPLSAMVLEKVKPMIVSVACMTGFRCSSCEKCRMYECYNLRNLNGIEGGTASQCRLCGEGIGLGSRGDEPEATRTNYVIEVGIGNKGCEDLFDKPLRGKCLTDPAMSYQAAWEKEKEMDEKNSIRPNKVPRWVHRRFRHHMAHVWH